MPFPAKVDAETILRSALQIVEAEGLEALSMRSLAHNLGLAVSSLYRYYPDRASLETAIAAFGAGLLKAELELAKRRGGDAVLERALRSYRKFARTHPVLYALLVQPRKLDQAANQPFKELWNTLLSIVDTVTGDPDDTGAAVAVWSFVHGFITLEQAGQFGKSGPRGGFDRGLRALAAGLKTERG